MNETVTKPRVSKEKRQPFGNQTQKLAYPQRANFHRHWFNDDPGRIDQAIGAGYTHVEDKDGTKVKRVVGSNAGGLPILGYLMEIPEEWYKEDMAAQQKIVDTMDDAIRRGAVVGKPGEDGLYVRNIKISTGKSSQ